MKSKRRSFKVASFMFSLNLKAPIDVDDLVWRSPRHDTIMMIDYAVVR